MKTKDNTERFLNVMLVIVSVLVFSSTIWAIYHETIGQKAREKACKEICAPYQSIVCVKTDEKFWDPRYIKAIAVCNSPNERKVFDIER